MGNVRETTMQRNKVAIDNNEGVETCSRIVMMNGEEVGAEQSSSAE